MARAVVTWWVRWSRAYSPAPLAVVTAQEIGPFTVLPLAPPADAISEPEAPLQPQLESREGQELRWAKEYALQHGMISRRIVERGLGIASARAQFIVKALDDLGWLLPARAPHP